MKNPIAEADAPDSLKLVKPQDADYDDQEKNYFCLDRQCLDPDRKLYLKRSTKGKLYFSHGPGFDHEYSPETLLRKLAVAHFGKLRLFPVPGRTVFDKSEVIEINPALTEIDYVGPEGDKPDILLTDIRGDQYYVEVSVLNPVSDEKIDAAKKAGLPLIELNLIDFYKDHIVSVQEDVDFIRNYLPLLVENNTLKKWRHTPKTVEHAGAGLSKGLIGAALVSVAALGVFVFLKIRK